MLMNLEQLYDEKKSLPLGHVRRKEIDRIIDKEYQACRDLEKKLFKNLPKYLQKKGGVLSPKKVRSFYKYASTNLKLRPVTVKIGGCSRGSGGTYSASGTQGTKPRTISFPSYCKKKVATKTALHEFSHHVTAEERMWEGGSHGSSFLWALEMVFETFEAWWKDTQET